MSLSDLSNRISRMSPLKRLFTSAALAIPLYAVGTGLQIAAGPVGGLLALGVSLAGVMFAQSYADPRMGTYNFAGMHLSKDGMHNALAFIGSSILIAPTVVGAALGLVLAAAPAAEGTATQMAALDSPAPITQTIEPS